MLYVQGGRRGINGEKEESMEKVSPSQVNHTIMEALYPLKGITGSF